ncbi:hypothetical protein DL93DRAFT_2232779 [Clavulina sp. PMI_390]|nr:hypothetical protein DL93DRAFT_2232779 [Clavulina sp. PMI_390]
MSPNADSNHVTFPDGDIIIRCNDGAEFRVHSFMLRHSSSYFSNMAALRIDRFLLDYLENRQPLLSWALAVRYGLVDARKKACIRVINEAIDIPGTANQFPELDDIPSRTVLRLQAIQMETLKQCRKELEGITWTCRLHTKTEWVERRQRLLGTRPLTIPIWGLSGKVVKVAMRSYWSGAECENCRKVYGKHSEDAEARIQRVNKTVEAAADDEALTGN